jgi:aspartyl-tRNA(Asn)/glutamyl-tRNA(Gln) amidotransferase subunit A
MTDSPARWSVAAITEQVGSGATTARSVCAFGLERIEERRSLNAFITVTRSEAQQRAEAIDRDVKNGSPPGPLIGVPVAIKDNICVNDVRCTCASNMLRDWIAPYDAAAVERLRKAGAVIVGKTNLDEFGMGSSTENSTFGPSHNPVDPSRTAGGSSGGSAVAVADGQCAVALGTDTGGSVRLPAAFCGVVGLKPSYGAVSRWGVVAFGSSLDQIGVFGRSVDDVRIVFDVIRGRDERDATSVILPSDPTTPDRLRIGMPTEYFGDGLDPQIASAVRSVADRLVQFGHQVVDVSLPNSKHSVAAYYVIATAEASSNLARYDGVRYGHRAQSDDVIAMYEKTRAEGFGVEVKRRILLGTYVLSAGYYDAYYGRAQRVRALIAADFDTAFQRVDCLLTPTAPTCAFKLGERSDDPLAMYLTDIYTTSVNLAGLPALSVPCGRSDEGLPIGAQLIGPAFHESRLLSLGGFIMDTTGGRN